MLGWKRTVRKSEPQPGKTAGATPAVRNPGLYDGLLGPAAGDVSKVLGVQRWTVQRRPFSGFGSPPGRF